MNKLYLKNPDKMYLYNNWKSMVLVLAFFLMFKNAYSQDKEVPKELYIASNISDSLKDDANSVIRYSDIIRASKGPGKENIKVHTIVTILNEKGDDEAIMRLNYNKKFNSFSDIEMRVFDDKGILIKKYHKGDMYDGAASDDETLVSDDRFLAVKHTIVSYPITIEKQYEIDETSLLNIGGWDIQNDEQSIQTSYYRVLIDNNSGFRYLSKNTTIKPAITTIGDKVQYAWQITNLKAIKKEDGAEEWRVF